jgi:hypothetical protein
LVARFKVSIDSKMDSSRSSLDGGNGFTPMDSSSSRSSVDSRDVDTEAPLATDPSVIVGLGFRFPGASNVSQLWENLAQKKDLQRKMPADRFNVDAFYHPLGTNKGTVRLQLYYAKCLLVG